VTTRAEAGRRAGREWARIRGLAVLAGILVLLAVGAVVVNQTAQVVALAAAWSPALGRAVLVALLLVYAGLLAVPLWLLARLPRALGPPPPEADPAFAAYRERLAARLDAHPLLAGRAGDLRDRAELERALAVLDRRADELIRAAASTVFVSTAISQNGRLDGLLVLAAHSRLVWRLAHLYHQRPSLRELVQLYANVAATALVVAELEDLDIDAQVEPLIAAALASSAAGAVPGASAVATILLQSVLDGAANAFLTLRIGVLARRYCGLLARPADRRGLRRAATVEAAGMLGGVVAGSAGVVSRAVLRGARRAGAGTVASVAEGLRGLGERVNPFRRAPEG
jgi:hypothetical protein